MGTETLKPLLPSCLYSTLVLSRDSVTDLGIAAMICSCFLGLDPFEEVVACMRRVLEEWAGSCARAGVWGFL